MDGVHSGKRSKCMQFWCCLDTFCFFAGIVLVIISFSGLLFFSSNDTLQAAKISLHSIDVPVFYEKSTMSSRPESHLTFKLIGYTSTNEKETRVHRKAFEPPRGKTNNVVSEQV